MIDAILNILNSKPVQIWSFDNCKVKLSPHTPPIIIHGLRFNELTGEWNVDFDSTSEVLEDINHKEALATILQRLKYLSYAG